MGSQDWVDAGLRALEALLVWPVAVVVLAVWFRSEIRQAARWVGEFLGKRSVRAEMRGLTVTLPLPPQDEIAQSDEKAIEDLRRGADPAAEAALSALKTLVEQQKALHADVQNAWRRLNEQIDHSNAFRIVERVKAILNEPWWKPVEDAVFPVNVQSPADNTEPMSAANIHELALIVAAAIFKDIPRDNYQEWVEASDLLAGEGYLVRVPPFTKAQFQRLVSSGSMTWPLR